MSTRTLKLALPDALHDYIAEQVQAGRYANASDYLRDLVLKDQEDQGTSRWRDLIGLGPHDTSGRASPGSGDKQLASLTRGEID